MSKKKQSNDTPAEAIARRLWEEIDPEMFCEFEWWMPEAVRIINQELHRIDEARQ